MFTDSEKESRHGAIRQILDTDGLKALLLIGDRNIGPGFLGDFRYYTNNTIIYYRQIAVLFPDSAPVLFTPSEVSSQAAVDRSFMSDCRPSYDYLPHVTELLKERGVSQGRIGVNFEMLPVAWFGQLKQEFPQIEWVDTHERIMQIRLQRSQAEVEAYRAGATLADGEFEAAVNFIRPGVSEHEIVAEIEHYGRARGVEEHFTLIGSGKFALGHPSYIYAPSHRRIEIGDCVKLEITPRYEGYWTQLNRLVSVGKCDDDLEKMQKVCCEAIQKGLEQLKPGAILKNIYLTVKCYLADCGYELNPPGIKGGIPLGHVQGVDLAEDRLEKNAMPLKQGTSVIIHPMVRTPDGKKWVVWGETYLVTADGYERLNRASDELLTL